MKGSFDQVMHGLEYLKKHLVDFNILCTIHAANQNHPLEVYHFFRDELGAQYIQFIPIVERAIPETLPVAIMGWSERSGCKRPLYTQNRNLVTDRSVTAEQHGRFLRSSMNGCGGTWARFSRRCSTWSWGSWVG